MASNHIMHNAVMKAMDVAVLQIRRQNCCEPYDCMCHELCDEEMYGGVCGGCKDQTAAWAELRRYTHKRNVSIPEVMAIAYEAIKQDREWFYRETRYDDNAGAHWTDERNSGYYDQD